MAIEALALNAESLARVRKAAGSRDDLAAIADDIARGSATLICCEGCFFVLRGEGDELVIVVAEGKNLKAAAPQIVNKAKKDGFKTLRFHTKRPALNRLLSGYGFKEQERVYRAWIG